MFRTKQLVTSFSVEPKTILVNIVHVLDMVPPSFLNSELWYTYEFVEAPGVSTSLYLTESIEILLWALVLPLAEWFAFDKGSCTVRKWTACACGPWGGAVNNGATIMSCILICSRWTVMINTWCGWCTFTVGQVPEWYRWYGTKIINFFGISKIHWNKIFNVSYQINTIKMKSSDFRANSTNKRSKLLLK